MYFRSFIIINNFSFLGTILTFLHSLMEIFLCQQTYQSAVFMASLCGVRTLVNNFASKSTRPRDMLLLLKDALSIKGDKLFKACSSVWSSVLEPLKERYPHPQCKKFNPYDNFHIDY